MSEIEEFKVLVCKKSKLNKDIAKFRIDNPNYEIYNISALGSGTNTTIRVGIIWKIKK